MSGVAVIVGELLADARVRSLVSDRILPHQASETTTLPLLSVFSVGRTERAPVSLAHGWAHVSERVQVDAVVSRDSPQELAPLLQAAHRACANKRLDRVDEVIDIVIRPAGRGPQLPDEQRHLETQSLDFLVSFNEPTGLTTT